MKVDELNNIEETLVEEVSQDPVKPEELSEEDKQRAFEFFVKKGKQDYIRYIRDIEKYVSDKEITVLEAIEEAQNSKSGLTFSRRQFLLAISPEVWKRWIPEKQSIEQFNYGE